FVLRATSNSMDLRNFTCTRNSGAEFVGFSQDARWIAVGDPSRNLEIWSIEGTKPVWTRRARNMDVLIPAFRPDGTGFACVSAESQVCLRRFDAREKQDKQILMSVESGSVAMSFAPDGENLAVAHRGGLELWNLKNASQKWRLDLEVSSLQPAWSADGQFVAVCEFANNSVVLVNAGD